MSKTFIHIHAPQPSIIERARLDCPTCEMKTGFLTQFTEWYGWEQTCLSCGDAWSDGERRHRPFMRGWREERIREALAILEAKEADVKSLKEVRAILLSLYKELKSWQEVGMVFLLPAETVKSVAKDGHEPTDPKARRRLGLAAQ